MNKYRFIIVISNVTGQSGIHMAMDFFSKLVTLIKPITLLALNLIIHNLKILNPKSTNIKVCLCSAMEIAGSPLCT